MEPLTILHTKVSPRIIMDPEKGEFSFVGRSIPADPSTLFTPVDKWVQQFASEFTGKSVTLDVKLDHLNTGSVRSMLTILTRFIMMKEKGVEVIINWHHEDDDDDIRDKGEEMSLIVEHPFVYIPYKVIY
jgi:SiaC family regulatory phosphoprotein